MKRFATGAMSFGSISHEAHSRRGFALGSVIAAEWLLGKKGEFQMKDVLNF